MEKDRILIVEDEKDTSYVLNKLLSKNNYEVEVAKNGEKALEILKGFSPQVILADWTMPVMNGLDLCDILKKDEKYKLIYFIILTARASLKDRVKGLDVGADDFLIKPVENQELLARIRSGIRIYKLQNELKKIEHSNALIEMACTIGHNINNPLSSLVIAVKNIEDEIKSEKNANIKDDLNMINESIERIKKLVIHLVKLDNPELVDYTSTKKMIKI